MRDQLDWVHNETIWAGFIAWFLAQLVKTVGNIIATHKMDLSFLFKLGGMPSSHSALVCAVAASIGFRTGFDSAFFALAVTFAAVVMFDAQSVRRAAGQQARLLNQIIEEIFKEHRLSQEKLVELLGHTRLEVFFGMVMGILVAIVMHSFPL